MGKNQKKRHGGKNNNLGKLPTKGKKKNGVIKKNIK